MRSKSVEDSCKEVSHNPGPWILLRHLTAPVTPVQCNGVLIMMTTRLTVESRVDRQWSCTRCHVS